MNPYADKRKYIKDKTIGVHVAKFLCANPYGFTFIPAGWIVHHRNCDHSDNRISNLIIIPMKTHSSMHSKIPRKKKRQIRKSSLRHFIQAQKRNSILK